MKRLTIRVTQDDINLGQAYSGAFCPIARAMKRAFGLGSDDTSGKVYVGNLYAEYSPTSLMTDQNMMVCPLPDEATEFITEFDGGREVVPFTFEVDCK